MISSKPVPRWFEHVKPTNVRFDTALGKLIAQGSDARLASGLPGAYSNHTRNWVEVSLTLDSLRHLKRAYGFTQSEMAERMSAPLLNWARAAGRYEKQLIDIHQRLDAGWRLELPWDDSGTNKPQFQHQEVMATVACSLDGVAFLCEMGTGKTRAAVESIRYKFEHDQLDIVVVVCPKSVMGTWQREIKLWANHTIPVVRLDGPVKERVRKIQQTNANRFVYVVNYETLHSMEDTWCKLMDRKRVGFVLDEIHRIKNPQAQMTKAAMEIARHAHWRLGQTGTLVLNGIQDVWAPWYFIDLGVEFGANFVQFRREWLDENPWAHTLSPKPGALEGIGAKLRRRGLRYTKDECLDLPPQMYEIEELEMTPEQGKAYAEMRDHLITEIRQMEREGTATAANQLVVLLRLGQITSGFVPTEEGQMIRFDPNPKLERLEEMIREQITNTSVIVWCRFRPDVKAIAERLRDLEPVIIIGGQTPKQRDEAEAAFKEGRSKLLIGTPGSGGEGLDLWVAGVAFYYSQDFSLKNREQSESRSHRKGSEIHKKVTYVDLLCKGTVDQIVLDALNGKKSVAAAVQDLRSHIGLEKVA